MADQATPGHGDHGVLTKSKDDVSTVHRTEGERTTEALEKSRAETDEVTLPGGITNPSIKDAFAAANKRKNNNDLAWELLAALPSNATLNEWLDDAQEKLNEAKSLIAEMRSYESRLYQTPDGKTDWDRIAKEKLSKEKYDSANGDLAALVSLLQDEYVDAHGQPVDDSDLAMALARRSQAEEALNEAKTEINKVDEAHEAGAGDDESKRRSAKTKEEYEELQEDLNMDVASKITQEHDSVQTNLSKNEDFRDQLFSEFSKASQTTSEEFAPEEESDFEYEDIEDPFGGEDLEDPFGDPVPYTPGKPDTFQP